MYVYIYIGIFENIIFSSQYRMPKKVVDMTNDDEPKAEAKTIIDLSKDDDDHDDEDFRGTFKGSGSKKVGSSSHESLYNKRGLSEDDGDDEIDHHQRDRDKLEHGHHPSKTRVLKKVKKGKKALVEDDDDLHDDETYNKHMQKYKGRFVKPPQYPGQTPRKSKKTKEAWKLSTVRREGQKRSDYKEAVMNFLTGRLDMNSGQVEFEREKFMERYERDKINAERYIRKHKGPDSPKLRNMTNILATPCEIDKYWKLESPYNSDLSYTGQGFTSESSDFP
jgi:hypothetical protein